MSWYNRTDGRKVITVQKCRQKSHPQLVVEITEENIDNVAELYRGVIALDYSQKSPGIVKSITFPHAEAILSKAEIGDFVFVDSVTQINVVRCLERKYFLGEYELVNS